MLQEDKSRGCQENYKPRRDIIWHNNKYILDL